MELDALTQIGVLLVIAAAWGVACLKSRHSWTGDVSGGVGLFVLAVATWLVLEPVLS